LLTAPCTTSVASLSLHDALPIYCCNCPAACVACWVLLMLGMISTASVARINSSPIATSSSTRVKPGRDRTDEGTGRSMAQSPRGSEEHTSELQSPDHLVCRLLLE